MEKIQYISDYYSAQFKELVNYACKIILDRTFAEDIVQDAFVKVMCSDRIFSDVTLPCLMHTVVRHLALDRIRHRKIADEYSQYVLLHYCAITDEHTVYDVHEMTEILERGIACLSEKKQKIYRMNIYDDMKVVEISRQLSWDHKYVENQLFSARREMRCYITQAYRLA